MIILGIDPGTIFLGYCIYDSVTDQVIKSGAIHTKKWRDKNIITFLQRSRIFIHGLIKKYQVEQCCLERTFTFRNSLYTSLLVVMTDVMKEAAGELVPSSTIQVTRWRKLLLNDGKSNKKKCLKYINAKYKKTSKEDEAEAIGIAVAYIYEITNTFPVVRSISRKSMGKSKKRSRSGLFKKPKIKRANIKKV